MNKPCTVCDKRYKAYLNKRGEFECDYITVKSCDKYKKYQDQLEKRRKYIQGETIKSISEFEEFIKDNSYVYWRGKIKHISWLISLQYRVLRNLINHGFISKAIEKEKSNGDN